MLCGNVFYNNIFSPAICFRLVIARFENIIKTSAAGCLFNHSFVYEGGDSLSSKSFLQKSLENSGLIPNVQ